jgi:hypothetical protein
LKNIPLERFFTKKGLLPTPTPPAVSCPAWEVRVPMLTNPIFVLDASLAFGAAWFFPSVLFAVLMDFAGFGREEILFVVSWVGVCVALLVGVCCFFILVRFGNGYYARYTLSAAGIACEIAHELPLSAPESKKGSFILSCRARRVSSGSISFVGTEKWATWDKIQRVKVLSTLRVVTLSDAFLPVFRIFCPDDATCDRVLEFCTAMLAQNARE